LRNKHLGTRMAVLLGTTAAVVVFIAVVMPVLSTLLTDLWWFEDVGQKAVFVKRLGTSVMTGLAAFALVAALTAANAAVIRKNVLKAAGERNSAVRSISGMAFTAAFISSLAAGFSMGASWMKVQQFLNAASFGSSDPIFGLDISFYVFKMPLFSFLYGGAMQIAVTAIATAGIAYLIGAVKAEPYDMDMPGPFGARKRRSYRMKYMRISIGQRNHLIMLVLIAFAVRAAGYLLDMYNLVYSPRGVAFGASYADLYGTLPGLKVMMALCLVAAGLIAYALIRGKGLKPVIAAGAIMAAGSFLAGTVVPGLVQQWYVEPNELAAEKRFIEYNIKATRAAYNLDKIEERDFVSDGDITSADLAANSRTVDNIRLWDWQPLLSTLSQLQEMRLYYSFYDVDIDRYTVDGRMRQVMLTAREMDVDSLPQQAQTWINRHLKYTHGYGLVISPVNEATSEGLPTYFLKDIPPAGNAAFGITRPEIYFGEMTNDYAIVDTNTDEFDYPMGEQNAETRWQGDGGVAIDTFFRKLAFSYRFGTVKMLLSADLTEESRMLYKRQINERLRSLAPFLWYDQDPYIVISEGRLKWVADAYTYTDAYPYSQPLEGYVAWGRGPNYMRRGGSPGPGVFQDIPGPVRKGLRNARGHKVPLQVPGGHVPGPGEDVRGLPHGGPVGLLQQGGPVEHTRRSVRLGHDRGEPVLRQYGIARPRRRRAEIPGDDTVYALQEEQHGLLAGRAVRQGRVRQGGRIQVLETEDILRADADRIADRPGFGGLQAVRALEPEGLKRDKGKSPGISHRPFGPICRANIPCSGEEPVAAAQVGAGVRRDAHSHGQLACRVARHADRRERGRPWDQSRGDGRSEGAGRRG